MINIVYRNVQFASIGQAVSEEKMFEHCGLTTTTTLTEHGYTISMGILSPGEPDGSCELKQQTQKR